MVWVFLKINENLQANQPCIICSGFSHHNIFILSIILGTGRIDDVRKVYERSLKFVRTWRPTGGRWFCNVHVGYVVDSVPHALHDLKRERSGEHRPWWHTLHSDGVPFAGDSLETSYLFYDRPSRLSSNAPACRGQSRLSGFCCAHRLCVRSPCQHISRMRTFDNNSCAISITSPRSIFVPGTQHVWWGRREKSRRASTLCDCRGKS